MMTAIMIIMLLISLAGTAYAEDSTIPPAVRGRVTKIISTDDRETDYSGGSFKIRVQIVEVKILKGKYAGLVFKAEHSLNSFMSDKYTGALLDAGDEVLLYLEELEDGTVGNVYVAEIVRDKYLFYLVAAFVLILLFIGRTKGLKALVALVFTCFGVLKVLLPMILKGHDPILVSVGVCTGIIAGTLLLVSGFNKKTLAAIIGTTGGVMIAGTIAQIVGHLAKLSGMGDEESQMLLYIPQNTTFDFKGLLFAGIIIGALGAAMDVGMSIASSMQEIKSVTPKIKRGELIKAGMNVGKDIMATMSNTLILAYAGGSLQLMLLLMAYKIPFMEIINRDVIASEILRSMAGSIGLLFTIPITAVTTGFLSEKEKKKSRNYPVDYR